MADIVDLKVRQIVALMRENTSLRAEWRMLFIETVRAMPDDVFRRVYEAAKPIIEEWAIDKS